MSIFPVIFVLFFVIAVALVVLGIVAAKKRRDLFRATAAQRGWRYTESDDRWVDRFEHAPFGTGMRRRAENILEGTSNGRGLVAFDYSYQTESTSTDAQGHTTTHTTTHNFSVLALNLGADLPALSVGPEGFFARMVDAVTNADIDFESEDFNRSFRVTCPDRKFASDVINPQMMEFLMPHRKIAWNIQHRYLVTISSGSASMEQIDQKLAFVNGIADRIPKFVWEQYGVQADH